MTTVRPIPLDDYGDQFPGALPAPAPAPAREGRKRVARMHAAYVHKVNAVVAAGNDALAHDLAQSFAEESADANAATAPADRRSAERHTRGRRHGGRPPGRVSRFTRDSLERLDRYTLDVFNAGAPCRSRDDRQV